MSTAETIAPDSPTDTGLDRVLFRRRLQRFWRESNWRPVGGWKGEKLTGQVADDDAPESPPMLAFVKRSER